MNFVHLIYVPMTGVGLYGGYRGDAWYAERIEIFKNYTLKSFLNQKSRNFVLWLSFRPQEERSPLTADLANYLKSVGMPYVLTFDGLMYHDDKFGGSPWNKFRNMLRVFRGAWRNKTGRDIVPALKELFHDKNSTLLDRLAKSLFRLKRYFNEAEVILMTRIDSDDMISQNTVQNIQGAAQVGHAIVLDHGYILNTDTGEWALYNPTTNPPFYTLVFERNDFFQPDFHLEFYKGFQSHEDIPRLFPLITIGSAYCVTVRNPKMHISTVWNHPFRGKIIPSQAHDFGIEA